MNELILQLINDYPTDGTYPYWWPRDNSMPEYAGVTEDLFYKDVLIAKSFNKRTYCCGLVFEVWLKSAIQKGIDISVEAMKDIRSHIFNAAGNRQGAVDILPQLGLGQEVTYSEAQGGDLIQIWRKRGSGHSCIFIDHIETGIRYWSTQPPNGIGFKEEYHTPVKQSNDIVKYHICRPTWNG